MDVPQDLTEELLNLIPEESELGTALRTELEHGILVSSIAYEIAKEYGLSEKECYQLAVAGMLHDIGKLKLGLRKNNSAIEQMRSIRTHPTIGYLILKEEGYSDFILQSICYHHENFDGTGYPSNLEREEIPIGARILRVSDVYSTLTSGRPYRGAYSVENAMELMIEEISHFDMEVFLALQKVVHKRK